MQFNSADPRRQRAGSRAALALAALAALTASPLAGAAGLRAGADLGSEARRAFLGIELPTPGPLHEGLVQRFRLDWESDSYGGGADRRSQAAEYSLGYQHQGDRGWWGGYLGLQYRELDRSRARPRKDDADDGWRLGFHFDGERTLGPDWSASGRLDTFPASDGYRVGGRLMRGVGDNLSIGPEIVLESDRDHDLVQVGVVLKGLEPMPGLQTAIKAGAQRLDDDTGPFIGIEFSRRF